MARARFYRRFAKLLTIALLPQVILAQSGSQSSIREGVYTAEQSEQGKAIYQSRCSMCHGNSLEGRGPNSPLVGPAFMNNWAGQTVADLFMKTIVMMPATDPGTMTPRETAEVVAYILSANKFPAGKAELPGSPQPLEKIHIVRP